MDSSLTISSASSLFVAMLILALVPSLSVITVTARSAAYGFTHGALTALGIVAGDVVFILIAVMGLAAMTESVQGLRVVLKYAGGVYLIWLGFKLWKPGVRKQEIDIKQHVRLSSSFMAGFLLTLSDQKAILFYLVFLPAFMDLSKITLLDTVTIVVIAIISIGSAKLGYAYFSDKVIQKSDGKLQKFISVGAAFVMVSVGMLLLLK